MVSFSSIIRAKKGRVGIPGHVNRSHPQPILEALCGQVSKQSLRHFNSSDAAPGKQWRALIVQAFCPLPNASYDAAYDGASAAHAESVSSVSCFLFSASNTAEIIEEPTHATRILSRNEALNISRTFQAQKPRLKEYIRNQPFPQKCR